MGTEVQKAGIACYERVQTRQRPIIVSRDQAPVKQLVEKGPEIDVRRFPALRHHRMDPGRYITEGHFLTFNRNTGIDNSAMWRRSGIGQMCLFFRCCQLCQHAEVLQRGCVSGDLCATGNFFEESSHGPGRFLSNHPQFLLRR